MIPELRLGTAPYYSGELCTVYPDMEHFFKSPTAPDCAQRVREAAADAEPRYDVGAFTICFCLTNTRVYAALIEV